MTPLVSVWASVLASASLSGASEVPDPVPLTDADQVGPCGFPFVAIAWSSYAQCSAVLVHPRVVLLAKGCFDYALDTPTMDFQFGEHVQDPHAFVQVPRADCAFSGNLGFCTLPDPVAVPYAPILAGCETGALHDGAEVTLVGIGSTGPGMYNPYKLWAEGVVEAMVGPLFYVDGESVACDGDSGGPALVRMADGSWRVAGVALDNPCSGSATYADAAQHVDWIERASGFDVTPCHDADGLPEPGLACGSFWAGDADGGGSWADMCTGAPVGPAQGSCVGDTTAPGVIVTAPLDGDAFAAAPAEVTVEVSTEDGGGLGVRDVRLEIDGELLGNEDLEPPFAFDVELPEGEWTIAAVARDWAGNVGTSSAITITVGDVAAGTDDGPASPEDASSGGESSGAAASSDEGSAAAVDDDTTGGDPGETFDGQGCACAAAIGERSGAVWLGLALAGLLRGRRRRHVRSRIG